MEQEPKSAQDEELARDFSFWSLFKFTGPSIFTFVFIAVLMVVLYCLRGVITGIYFRPDTEFYRISLLGYVISLPACLFSGYNQFGSGLFTAFSNGIISGFLSLMRTFGVLIICPLVLTALFSGYGLWSAWPAAEAISFVITAVFLRKFRGKYQYA